MSWLSDWLKKRKLNWLADIALQILKAFIGKLAEGVWEAAQHNVSKAEGSGKPGVEKFKMAYEGTLSDLGGYDQIPSWLLRAIIEIAVGLIDSKLK